MCNSDYQLLFITCIYGCQIKYRIAGNFRKHKFSRITNQHARKKFRDFYFRNKVMISDHTPYNFPHVNGDLQRVFQRQNDSKTLACLSKRVGRCRQKLPCRREGADSEDLFAVAVRSRKISGVCSMHSTRGTTLFMLDGSTTNLLSIY